MDTDARRIQLRHFNVSLQFLLISFDNEWLGNLNSEIYVRGLNTRARGTWQAVFCLQGLHTTLIQSSGYQSRCERFARTGSVGNLLLQRVK